jgi:hypothetical protein
MVMMMLEIALFDVLACRSRTLQWSKYWEGVGPAAWMLPHQSAESHVVVVHSISSFHGLVKMPTSALDFPDLHVLDTF